MSRLMSIATAAGLAALIVLAAFSCSSSRDDAKAAGVTVDRLAEDLRVLESTLRAEIEGAKSQSLILFVLGLGIGILGFLVVQHQIKRVRLTQSDKTHVVSSQEAPGPGTAGKTQAQGTVVVKAKTASAKKKSAAKKGTGAAGTSLD